MGDSNSKSIPSSPSSGQPVSLDQIEQALQQVQQAIQNDRRSDQVTISREQWQEMERMRLQLQTLTTNPTPVITPAMLAQYQAFRPHLQAMVQPQPHLQTSIRTDIVMGPAHPPQSTGAIPRTTRGHNPRGGRGERGRGSGPNRGGQNVGHINNLPPPYRPQEHNRHNNDVPVKSDRGGNAPRGAPRGRGGRGRGDNRPPSVVGNLIDMDFNPPPNNARGGKTGKQGAGKKVNDLTAPIPAGKVSLDFMSAKEYVDSITPAPNTNLLVNAEDKVVKEKKINNSEKPAGKKGEKKVPNLPSLPAVEDPQQVEQLQKLMAACNAYFEQQIGKVLATKKPEVEEEEVELPPAVDAIEIKAKFKAGEIPSSEVRDLLPSHWGLKLLYPNVKHHLLVQLEPDSMEFVQISTDFHKTVKQELKIQSISHVENAYLWYMFATRRSELTKLVGYEPQERQLFHGTDNKLLDLLFENGFNWSRKESNKDRVKRHGHGIALTPQAAHAAMRSKGEEGESKHMVLARVLQPKPDKSLAQEVEGAVKPDGEAEREQRKQLPLAKVIHRFDEFTCYPEFVIAFTGTITAPKDNKKK